VADINAIRDDCHMAAWRPLGVAGYVWEAFGQVADGTARTAESLFDALPYRGYSAADYAAALDELAARGWVSAGPDGYAVTAAGHAVRQQVEQATDAWFYTPWADFSAADLIEIRDDIDALNDWLARFAAA
jgi:hypothetical protein